MDKIQIFEKVSSLTSSGAIRCDHLSSSFWKENVQIALEEMANRKAEGPAEILAILSVIRAEMKLFGYYAPYSASDRALLENRKRELISEIVQGMKEDTDGKEKLLNELYDEYFH